MTEEYAGPRKPCDLVHGGDECAAVDEGYWGDDEEEIAFVKRWNCDPKTLGAYGEDLACELLKRNDYIYFRAQLVVRCRRGRYHRSR